MVQSNCLQSPQAASPQSTSWCGHTTSGNKDASSRTSITIKLWLWVDDVCGLPVL